MIQYVLNLAGFTVVTGHWIYYRHINKDLIVIDLGANEGAFSNEILKKYKAQCYAVEPNKNIFSQLINVNIVKLNYAITKENGPLNFYISKNGETSSVIKDFENNWGNRGIDVVEGITWNSLIDLLELKNKRINILKVDIEGSELDLIDSFNVDNLSNVEQLTIEFHDWLNVSLHERTINAIRKLISLDFTWISNSPNHSWPVEILFMNKKFIRFNFFQKFMMFLYQKLTFLRY